MQPPPPSYGKEEDGEADGSENDQEGSGKQQALLRETAEKEEESGQTDDRQVSEHEEGKDSGRETTEKGKGKEEETKREMDHQKASTRKEARKE